jgi:hypothetical protein
MRKVKSVRVPRELETLDLSAVIQECGHYLRDLESAALLKSQGDKQAAESLIRTRESDLGRRIGMLVWKARVRFGKTKGDD